jgi:hypothetical protein
MSLIPRVYHFVFGLRKQVEPFSLAYYLCLESCRKLNQPEKIYFYYHYEPYGPYWEAIRPILTLEWVPLNPLVEEYKYREAGLSPFRYAHHSDFVRMEKLVERGGVYADIDTLFLNPIPDELFDKSFVIGSEGHIRDPKTGASVASLCNAFLMCEPSAAFGRIWLERMAGNFDGSWSNHSTLLPQRLAEEFPELVHVEPETSFYPFAASIPGLAALFEAKVPVPGNAYSAHLWEHLWWDVARTDFSLFSGADLTEDYVRRANTTYGVAAIVHLPEDVSAGTDASPRTRTVRNVRIALGDFLAEVRAVISVAVYPTLKELWPGLGHRLAMARGFRAYQSGKRALVVRSPLEAGWMRQILERDQYGIFEDPLRPDTVVVDFGAQLGVFSFACHWLGSRSVRAFEWNENDFASANSNLTGLSGVRLDRARPALDEILLELKQVKILRLSCDATLWRELLGCRYLQHVERIVGECPAAEGAAVIQRHLEDMGMEVRIQHRQEELSIDARRHRS